MKLVSACLAGFNVRHDAGNKANKKVMELVKRGEAIPICPEQIAGFSTPREAREIKEGRVLTKTGEDVTGQLQKGAEKVLQMAKELGVKEVIFKAKSPSCGKGKVYDGTFSGKLVEGNGIATELLLKNGVKVLTEGEL
ncbi:MAG: DUF523 domain-containing protein [Candidatus Diapherotrites archaeon]|uniref:DUF523 domain-containing protein n=1 Tax=Candidatus Iainarchaeum sp. TaxID=3101447 RepID=A0A938YN88_9ARCH|nr:DUF523 domain-containing protein [Candidatus Diapherotrites archaeon]